MNKEELKRKILAANEAYRLGSPFISDIEFDELVEKFEKEFPDEYDEFRNSLNEGLIEQTKKVKHPFIMGSLDKVTIEKPNDIKKFISKYVKTTLNISAKIDGISCRLHYDNGYLISASTRGDGYEGTDITSKIKYIKSIPQKISFEKSLDIRGELVILTSDFQKISNKFANPRNACAGIINRKEDSKEWNEEDLNIISFICYTILDQTYSKKDQFSILKNLGFLTAWNENLSQDLYLKDDFTDRLLEFGTNEYEYPIDGLVISDSSYRNEDKYRPDSQIAVKMNLETAISYLLDIEWQHPSKDGKISIVGLIDPVQLCGTTVSRVTLNNLDFIDKLNLKYGSKVVVQKRGDIIPAIIKVVSNDNTSDIVYPTECPCCSEKLVREGPFLWCKNSNCSDQLLHQTGLFIKKLGVENTSFKSLENLKIYTIEDLLAFKANKKYKSELKLESEIYNKIFTKSKEELLYAMNFKDLSEVLLEKIISFYSLKSIEDYIKDKSLYSKIFNSLPTGVGQLTLDKFLDSIEISINIVNKIINDSRYHYAQSQISSNDLPEIKGSICVTGSLSFGSRSKFLEFARKNGYESKAGVSKGLTYLINNDINSSSSKNKKAKELGISILTEDSFLKLINKVNSVQEDLDFL